LATPATDIIVKSLIKPFFIWVSIQVKIKVIFSRSKKTQEIKIQQTATVLDLIKKIDLKPDTIIIMNNDKPIPIDNDLIDGQELTIIQVSSGG